MIDISSWNVYLVTDRSFSAGRTTEEIVRKAVEGGVSVVQLREKELETRAFYEEGLKIREMLKQAGVALLINDRIDVALALDADGVHLGRDDMPPREARRLLGPDKVIGLSVNTLDHVREESAAYADYLAISPVFFTGTKANITEPWGLAGVAAARAATGLPLCAIGGVGAHNARDVVRAGADFIAVVTAIAAAPDPCAAAEELVNEIEAGKRARVV